MVPACSSSEASVGEFVADSFQALYWITISDIPSWRATAAPICFCATNCFILSIAFAWCSWVEWLRTTRDESSLQWMREGEIHSGEQEEPFKLIGKSWLSFTDGPCHPILSDRGSDC
jgi:hypothetical protein